VSTHLIILSETGESFNCLDNETALNALARSGKRGIPIGCRGGGCGVCKVKVLDGDFSKRPMSRDHVSVLEEQNNEVLACCIYPLTDVKVQVLGKMQRAIFKKCDLYGDVQSTSCYTEIGC